MFSRDSASCMCMGPGLIMHFAQTSNGVNKNIQLIIIIAFFFIGITGGAWYILSLEQNRNPSLGTNTALAAKFDMLSKNGNSSCSGTFKDSIDSMSDTDRLQGSCCSPMDMHRYEEQVTGLQKYKDIPEIPKDPYDIDASLAKKLKSYYDVELTAEQQKEYDYAMVNSNEKGPCCCKCWRWYVYGGLGKLLIQKYNFTGEQVTEIWNLSDGCGGIEHHHHT